MPTLVTDPNQPENPIVFFHSAFLNLTGYTVEELRGNHCRLLQGPATSQATVSEIHGAIAEAREINTEILKYRKDGSTFWNALLMSPVENCKWRALEGRGKEASFFRQEHADSLAMRERTANWHVAKSGDTNRWSRDTSRAGGGR